MHTACESPTFAQLRAGTPLPPLFVPTSCEDISNTCRPPQQGKRCNLQPAKTLPVALAKAILHPLLTWPMARACRRHTQLQSVIAPLLVGAFRGSRAHPFSNTILSPSDASSDTGTSTAVTD